MKRGVALALLLSGCATYRPSPLNPRPDILSPPVGAVLTREAATIDRPFLKPVEIDLAKPLDLSAIAVLAVINNPDLKAQRLQAGVADAQVFTARLLPDPTFSIGASTVLSGPDPFLDIATVLGFDLNSLRTQGVKVRTAKAKADQVRLDLAWAEWQTSGQARIQAVRIHWLEQTVRLASASRASAESLLQRSLRAAGRGDINADQLQAARLAAANAQEQVRTAERSLGTARTELAKLLGLPPTYALRLAPLPAPSGHPDAQSLFEIARLHRADLRALEAGYEAQEATVRKAVLDQFPTLDLTTNVNRDTAGNLIVGPAVNFTLPLWNRNRAGIAIERATRAQLKAEYEARLFQTRSEIAGAAGAADLTRRQLNAFRSDLPAAERFATASRRAANRGDLALSTAETAEQALRDKLSQIAQAEQDLAEQTIALELLTGTPTEDWPR